MEIVNVYSSLNLSLLVKLSLPVTPSLLLVVLHLSQFPDPHRNSEPYTKQVLFSWVKGTYVQL